ncbi:MAG: tryptophan synthase subunit alpha [Alphaproteobacteria bacterium RIFCSPLOWO2_01_FULL_40_26]|nr:MAG: tryptophan synthase subunit alpha [Alphaproteobacteria bacterium RIFCSPHIGHO2_02_FULL_40_34]OFW94317.1 MAG: tryptophan synthase subunit alpha [Alphaproteobacteria bacterium RIFCSPLOWO2_01_FULL_40_26]OFX10002.1 MAG: tryptophan synthase subunit alpha [Alphaproteobacteria bacterium RIFCSPLOWO2_02_FULL_40_19]OFX11081.1 MAG: tryptophan synthase subunit alpha [Alphaproteobacteria bacterium RIFCSPLOWO2_12_FULL_40_11]
MKRIEQKFKTLRTQQKCGLVAYICAGDPDYETSLELLKIIPQSGVDIIELGVPFLDPSGDGLIIQDASRRAISAGMTLQKTLHMVLEFRKNDTKTPVILMSYYNPILKFGLNKIFSEAQKSGVDGFLIVDLPPEEEQEILPEIAKTNLDLIRLIAPTTNLKRAQKITKNASGFLYLISLLGITGTTLAKAEENKNNLKNLRHISNLPIAIGFGIQTPKQAEEFAKIGVDAVVVGSAIVKEMAETKSAEKTAKKIHEFSKKIK